MCWFGVDMAPINRDRNELALTARLGRTENVCEHTEIGFSFCPFKLLLLLLLLLFNIFYHRVVLLYNGESSE